MCRLLEARRGRGCLHTSSTLNKRLPNIVPTSLTTIRHPKVIRALSTTNRSNGDWKARVQIREHGNSRELLNSTTSRDIGTVAGSMLVFGGPYSNLEATEAVLEEASRRGIPSSRVLCTGDAVAYCADPAETIGAIRSAGIHFVQGNCEESLGTSALDCGCGFDPDSKCRALSVEWFAYANSIIGEEDRTWMRALPQQVHFQLAHAQCTALHGSASSISEFVFYSTAEEKKEREGMLCGAAADVVVGGHCGLPFSQLLGSGLLWHNAGVVGMPANDGTPRTWFSVLQPEEEALRVTHHPLTYNHEAAAKKMRERDLPPGYSNALITGLWPSLDVLPPIEAAQTGRPLDPAHMSYSIPWSALRRVEV